jgi:death-on-curing protein
MTAEFLELDDVAALHAESIRRFGGATGVRDTGLLESALAMPKATMFGELLHPSLEEQAAAYLFHLVKNHPFLDGNKRTGLAAALTFLGMNGTWVEATNDELIDLTLGGAEGRTSKAQVAVFFREHAEPWEARD